MNWQQTIQRLREIANKELASLNPNWWLIKDAYKNINKILEDEDASSKTYNIWYC